MANVMADARNEMSAVIYKAWDDNCLSFFGSSKEMLSNSSTKSAMDILASDVWARLDIRHTTQKPISLADDTGRILYIRKGILSFQCFIPISEKSPFDIAESICVNIRNVLQKHRGCVIFRNCSAEEGILEKSLLGFNVIADFEYSETL
ncbi:hypothetical protein [Vibrio phage vB_VibM_83AMN]|nr:hypothetical protein [Vibrio phage vB_VibM_83AMN]